MQYFLKWETITTAFKLFNFHMLTKWWGVSNQFNESIKQTLVELTTHVFSLS